jgi:ketosteroid isomerase-like protein
VNQTCHELANQFTAAFDALDAVGMGALYADNVVVWHNTDMRIQTKRENIAHVAGFFSLVSQAAYTSIVRTGTEQGFIQQHIIKGKFKDGREIPPTAACLVFTIEGGLITRLDEYLDPTAASKA